MPISRITRNSLVYANNKTQNIESRIFGLPISSGSLYLQNSQSLYLQDLSGTYVLEYPSTIALSYNSYYNKSIADRSTQNSSLKSRYYISESKTNGDFGYILYQNSRSMYNQATPDIYLIEYSSTSSLLNDTGSSALSLKTRYYVSESKTNGDFGYILYQNSRSMYNQSVPDIYLIEYSSTSSLLNDSGSSVLSLKTRYYISESKALANVGSILYQNSRSVYLQDATSLLLLYDPNFVPVGTSASLQETGSSALSFRTRYYNSESKASIAYLGYQNDRAVYLENTANPFVIEYGTSSSLLTDSGSSALSFRTRYYNSESKASIAYLGYQNDRAVYLENTANPFVIEYGTSSSLLTDSGSSALSFNTKYYNSESIASITYLGYQNDRAVYLENTANPFVIEYSATSSLLTDSGSSALSFNTKYYNSESIASITYLGYQNDRAIYLENITDIFIIE